MTPSPAKQLLIFPTGSLTAKEKERLSKHGFLAIESPDPARIIVSPENGVVFTKDDLLYAALRAIREDGFDTGRQLMNKYFTQRLVERIGASTKRP